MHWNAIALSVIAALALPVVGLITGRVVGDFFLRGDLIGATGAAFGVLVYALALASSYSHLRHYYKGYEAQGVRASWALALAVEVATFYMSFSYVVIQSAWAFWGSLIGAYVVFWGNLSSMYEARMERVRVVQAESSTASAAQELPQYETIHSAFAAHSSEAVVETKISQVRQSVREVKVAVTPVAGEPVLETPTHTRESYTQPQMITQEPPPLTLSEVDREVLRLAAAGPIGPSAIARALGIAKSSAGDRLKRLERMGLLVKRGSSYVPTEEGRVLYEGTQASG